MVRQRSPHCSWPLTEPCWWVAGSRDIGNTLLVWAMYAVLGCTYTINNESIRVLYTSLLLYILYMYMYIVDQLWPGQWLMIDMMM